MPMAHRIQKAIKLANQWLNLTLKHLKKITI